MNSTNTAVLVGVMLLWPLHSQGDVLAQEKPKVKIPESGVSQIMTMEGKFVRAAYNNEGYVILGYQLVNRSVGEDWMLLEVGYDGARQGSRLHLEAGRVVARYA
jgi:hypothetical protein